MDEWIDDARSTDWLPSFVLPRDPAVAKIVDSAQRYLMAIADDPSAGFDGYQSWDASGATPAEQGAAVDAQVRAIWSALLYDAQLSYINPPPTYTRRSQRLRTPSEVVGGRRGTCIDLALLVAACLEYVDIYPAVILLKDHAFPAYWRSEQAQADFAVTDLPTEERNEASRRPGWSRGVADFERILQLVHSGELVPLETVWLTQHEGFASAVEAGIDDLSSRRNFYSLVDIVYARRTTPPVTPLPIVYGDR